MGVVAIAGGVSHCGDVPEGHVFPTYVAPRTADPIAIDGVLDELIWGTAPLTRPFVSHSSGEEADYAATARVCYDGDALYVAITCPVPDVSRIKADYAGAPEKQIIHDDTVELFFDPDATRVRFYQYIVNAAGATETGLDCSYDTDLPVEAATTTSDSAWMVEARLPFSGLGTGPAPGERWGMNLCQSIPGIDGGHRAWTPTFGGFRLPGRFGYLVFGDYRGNPQPAAEASESAARRLVSRVEDELAGGGRWGAEDLRYEARVERAARLVDLMPAVSRSRSNMLLYTPRAITDERTFPWTVPTPAELGRPISITCCRGEYEPATLAVFALGDLEGVLIDVPPLRSDSGALLPPSSVDVREVVCWYQAGSSDIMQDRRVLLPELLLHDASLVTVDPDSRENTVAFEDLCPDSPMLRPTDIPACETRQFWLTVHVPAKAKPGIYRGEAVVTVGGEPACSLPLIVDVPGFELEPSPLLYSLYYTLRMHKLGSREEARPFMERMEAEIRNQVEHGINAPSTYVGGGRLPWDDSPLSSLQAVVDMQHRAGVRGAPIICVTMAVGWQRGEEQLAQVTEKARAMAEFARKNNREAFYFQGIDEAKGDTLVGERESFEAVRRGGSRVFVACRPNFFEVIGDVLDMPVVTGELHPELAPKVHSVGGRILSYGNPQTGVEKPDTYRRNYGLRLWAAGYDGSMNYEYQSCGKHPWDDFAGESYRNHTFAYPGTPEPIDTIQWEGWREGVDDVRYVASLQRALEEMDPLHTSPGLAAQAQALASSIDGEGDLYRTRSSVIEMIRRLRSRENPE